MAISVASLIDVAPRLKDGSLQTAQQLEAALEFQSRERILALGIPALDDVLPRHGLMLGSVTELQVHGASGAATSFALCACRAAQQTCDGIEPQRRWCAFIDPSASLFAPGLVQLGVELERLLVVRPSIDAIERVAIRIAEANVFSLLVIDLRGALGDLAVSNQRWPRTVRRLALAIKPLATSVLLITSAEPRQPLPLPVAMRLEFTRSSAESFEVRVGKERNGRVSSPRVVPMSAFDGPVLGEAVWQ
jgi:recombination protein RecA